MRVLKWETNEGVLELPANTLCEVESILNKVLHNLESYTAETLAKKVRKIKDSDQYKLLNDYYKARWLLSSVERFLCYRLGWEKAFISFRSFENNSILGTEVQNDY